MDYKKKYLKYKNKYLSLKNMHGGINENFKIHTLTPSDILYHGTHFKLTGKFFTPAYFSTDILQSFGHILTEYSKILKTDDRITQLIKIDKISKCYPSLYVYKVNNYVKLLKMLNPNNFAISFGLLFNKDILSKYIFENASKDKIMITFINKLVAIGKTPVHYNGTIENIKENIQIYLNTCELTCFGGWANTPGYYLLNMIDYNSYLSEVKIINPRTKIDGLYIEKDQDEIVLFDSSKLIEQNHHLILPYNTKDLPKIDKLKFITNYINNMKSYKTDDTSYNNLIHMFKQFSHIDDTTEWGFDWFITPCEKYNPYEKIEETCAKELKCKERTPQELGYPPSFSKDCLNPESRISSKLSIENMDNIDKLKDYIEYIKTKCSIKLFGLDINKLCRDVVSDETHRHIII